MADSEWEEFLRGHRQRAAAYTLPTRRSTTAVKATTGGSGPGAFALDTYPSINTFQRNANRLMNEALGLFRANPWVHIAEKTISDRFARLDWHLEDADGNTVEEGGTGVGADELEVQRLIERPSRSKTRRQLWSLTSRHIGLAGNAFWYLDGRNALGMPLEILYINPVRMTPRLDADGNLLGWMVDGPDNQVTGKPGNMGLPLETSEVIHFTLDEPDFGIWGIGIAEAAQTKIELDRLATRHEASVFASGGRLTGIVAPKPNQPIEVSDDQWKATIREWRNVTSDPDAAKRLIVVKGPIDFIPTSSNNEQLQLVELSGQGRDDILNSWGVPLSQIGISTKAGLNSGEKNKNDEAILWQGAIEPRTEGVHEKVQYELLDPLNLGLQLVIESPEFDDQTPLFDAVQKAATVPLKNNERREILGLDPFEDKQYGDLGDQVLISNIMIPIPTGPVNPATAPPQEPQLALPLLAPLPPAEPANTITEVAKAQLAPRQLLGQRHRLQPPAQRKVQTAVTEFLKAQRATISDNVRQRYAQVVKKPTDRQAWWNAKRWDELLLAGLGPILTDYARTVATRTTRTLKRATKASDAGWLDRVLAAVADHSGARIGGINDTTRERVQALIEQGVTQGLGPAELGDLIEEGDVFDEARAELIARTETALVYNEAALGSYREFDIAEVEAVDGDGDDECAARDGQTFSLDEADGIEDHPNGTLDWIPLEPVEAKAALPPGPAYWEGLAAMAKAAAIPLEIPAPIVNIEPSLAPIVNVDTAQFAHALRELKDEMAKPKPRPVLDRDEAGHLIGLHYE